MFEILMFFEEFPTFYLEHFLLLYKCLIKLSCPADRYHDSIKEYRPAGHLWLKQHLFAFTSHASGLLLLHYNVDLAFCGFL